MRRSDRRTRNSVLLTRAPGYGRPGAAGPPPPVWCAPPMPSGVEDGILRGMYLLQVGGQIAGSRFFFRMQLIPAFGGECVTTQFIEAGD